MRMVWTISKSRQRAQLTETGLELPSIAGAKAWLLAREIDALGMVLHTPAAARLATVAFHLCDVSIAQGGHDAKAR